jgi:hypothetical protein
MPRATVTGDLIPSNASAQRQMSKTVLYQTRNSVSIWDRSFQSEVASD